MNWIVDELYRLFIGSSFAWSHLFEIIFRTAFMYLYTILNVRLMDKRSMGMLSPFENISKNELYSILRMRGVLHIADVEFAYLEPSGSISIIKKDGVAGSDIIPQDTRMRI